MTKIAFFGSAEFAVPTLQLLTQQKDISLQMIITKPDKPAGRGLKMTPTPVKKQALELNLPVTEKMPSPQELKSLGVEKIVVVAYGLFIPESIFETWSCVNLHPSLLPKYRGPSPLQSALLNGDTKTGITTMLISKEMDAGDILLQKEIAITENMDITELHDRCANEGATLIVETLKQDLPKLRKKQDNDKAVLCKKITDEDSRLTPGLPAGKIHNIVRAIGGFVILTNGKRVKILKTELKKTGELEIVTVQPEGKPKMSYTDFLKGNPEIVL
jgi:methionyl-tRNA formyltransferase